MSARIKSEVGTHARSPCLTPAQAACCELPSQCCKGLRIKLLPWNRNKRLYAGPSRLLCAQARPALLLPQAAYKTVQGCLLRTTPATANFP